MTTADEIKQAVLSLPEAEYAKIMDWLHELGGGGVGTVSSRRTRWPASWTS